VYAKPLSGIPMTTFALSVPDGAPIDAPATDRHSVSLEAISELAVLDDYIRGADDARRGGARGSETEVDVRQVRYFLEAARTLNFTRAAEICHISQPALTMAIKRLEDELGGALFRRQGRGLVLTSFAKKMHPALSEFARHFERVHELAHMELALRTTPLRLGVLSTIGPVRISALLAEVKRRTVSIEVTVEEDSLDRLWARLADGSLDVCIANHVPDTPSRFQACRLYDERYVVVLPPRHPLVAKTVVKLADLPAHPYVDRLFCELRHAMAKTLEERQLTLYAEFRSAREDWVQSMVLAGVGYAVMPEYSVTHPELVIRPLAEPELRREIALLHAADVGRHAGLEAFVSAAATFDWSRPPTLEICEALA
jgi:DNA-binding transcriptional LysR family regulator